MRYEARCKACDELHQLTPELLQVNRWVGSWAGLEWQVIGWCPNCGTLILSVWLRYKGPALELIDAGAAVMALSRPRELYEIRVRALAPRLTSEFLHHGMDVLDDDLRLESELVPLTRRYGS